MADQQANHNAWLSDQPIRSILASTPQPSPEKHGREEETPSLLEHFTKAIVTPVQKGSNHAARVVGQGASQAAHVVEKGATEAWQATKKIGRRKSPESTPEQPDTSLFDRITSPTTAAFRTVAGDIEKTADTAWKATTSGVKKLVPKRSAIPSATAPAQVTVEPDRQLQSMTVVIHKVLEKVNVDDWYEICWSEGNGTNKPPFYGPWLEQSGKTLVEVGAWTFGADIVGEWDGEVYGQKRIVTFQLDSSSGFVPSSTTSVTHTQYARRGQQRCVLAMTVQMKGIPFADAFSVQLRWVATQLPDGNLSLQLGLFVVFVKQVIVASKIRSGTITNTTKAQLDLFRAMKTACGGMDLKTVEETDAERAAVAHPSLLVEWLMKPAQLLTLCFPFWKDDKDDIEGKLKKIHSKLRTIKALPATDASYGDPVYVLAQFRAAHEALDSILLRYLGKPPAPVITDEPDQVPAYKLLNRIGDPLRDFLVRPFKDSSSLRQRLLGPVSSLSMPSTEDAAHTEAHIGPDQTLKAMTLIIDKEIEHASVKNLYDVCFSEGQGTAYGPFYAKWLKSTGKFDIHVGGWQVTEEGSAFLAGWSGEAYDRKRNVSYRLERGAVLGQKGVVAEVEQIQLCRLELNQRLVWEVAVETTGVPFSDTFNVQIRWVATNVGDNLSIKVGLFVVQRKQTLLSGKISAGATQETTKLQLDLFRKVRSALGGGDTDVSLHKVLNLERELEKEKPMLCLASPLKTCLPAAQKLIPMYPETMVEDNNALAQQVRVMGTKLRAIRLFLDEKDSDQAETLNFVLSQLEVVDESLDSVIVWHGDQSAGQDVLADASFS